MSTEETNDDLKRLFSELRAREAPSVRAFDEFLTSAAQVQRAAPHRSAFPVRIAAAIALCAAAVVIMLTLRQQVPPAVPQALQWTAISDWKGSTDVLLVDLANVPWSASFASPSDSWIETRLHSSNIKENNL